MVLALFRLIKNSNPSIKSTLSVYLDKDDKNCLNYSYYGSWSPSGTPYDLENLVDELPSCANDYEHIFDIIKVIKESIKGVYVNKVHVVNDIPCSNLNELTYLVRRNRFKKIDDILS